MRTTKSRHVNVSLVRRSQGHTLEPGLGRARRRALVARLPPSAGPRPGQAQRETRGHPPSGPTTCRVNHEDWLALGTWKLPHWGVKEPELVREVREISTKIVGLASTHSVGFWNPWCVSTTGGITLPQPPWEAYARYWRGEAGR
ncbi:hypothetical protein CRENBAI_023089 [Crenichthys baileyi]|uniref:Uncharacterized protein n=1 Tax=Crenichthys baileyi TaxID=28760 RepID=A0AAV9RIA7_9TELE